MENVLWMMEKTELILNLTPVSKIEKIERWIMK